MSSRSFVNTPGKSKQLHRCSTGMRDVGVDFTLLFDVSQCLTELKCVIYWENCRKASDN
jgi:hypothetical protein